MSTDGQAYAAALGSSAVADAGGTPPPVERILEALLFASGQPLTPEIAATAIRGLTPAEFRAGIEALGRAYRRQHRPFTIQSTAQGYVLSLRSQYRGLRERLAGAPREARLSRAAVDVLAIIAFRQPVTRSEIDSQRGSDSASVVRQLLRLGLIVAEPPAPGATEPTYGTTQRFLDLFGLKSLDDLPQTMDLQHV
jgi:segregation and condensation protein B